VFNDVGSYVDLIAQVVGSLPSYQAYDGSFGPCCQALN